MLVMLVAVAVAAPRLWEGAPDEVHAEVEAVDAVAVVAPRLREGAPDEVHAEVVHDLHECLVAHAAAARKFRLTAINQLTNCPRKWYSFS